VCWLAASATNILSGSGSLYGDSTDPNNPIGGDDLIVGSGLLDGGAGNDTLVGSGTLEGDAGQRTASSRQAARRRFWVARAMTVSRAPPAPVEPTVSTVAPGITSSFFTGNESQYTIDTMARRGWVLREVFREGINGRGGGTAPKPKFFS